MPNTYLTKVITDTSPDFGDNPQTIQESGRPESVTINNLTPNTSHWTKAEIWRDGVLNDTSDVETFTTIQAGVMTLEFIQDGRSGYGYDISWRYTSTYAPSWCTLSINGQVFQGFIDSANSDLDFFITGLTPSTTYPYTVTLGDIYGETQTANGSLTTTYVNSVTILSTSADEFSVVCNVQYVVDGGFYNGWVDVWYDYQDPSTDLSLAHYYFNEGDTAVVCDGLNDNTGYLFRAAITLDDRTTVIVSNVKAETTEETTYLNFTDVSGVANTLKLTKTNTGGLAPTVNLEYSTDKHNWTTWTETNNERTLEIPANGTVWLRGDNANGFAVRANNTDNHIFSSTGNINADGDLMRIINKTKGGATMVPQAGFQRLFKGMTTLKKAPAISATVFDGNACVYMFQSCSGLTDVSNIKLENVSFNSANSLGAQFLGMFYQCYNLATANVFNGATLPVRTSAYRDMFAYCRALTSVPSLTINETSIPTQCFLNTFGGCNNARFTDASGIHLNSTNLGTSCYYQMFTDCTNLTTPPTITKNITSIGQTSMGRMFKNCTNFTTGIDIRNATSVGTDGLDEMYNGCTSLTTAYAPTVTWDTSKSDNWLNNVAASGTLYADERILSSIPTNNVNGCPNGWSASIDYSTKYFTITNETDQNVDIDIIGQGSYQSGIAPYYISTDGTTWTEKPEPAGDHYTIATLAPRQSIMMKHTGANATSGYYVNIVPLNNVSLSGNIASMCHGDEFNKDLTPPAYGFRGMFSGSAVISAENLSFDSYSGTLSDSCFKNMFDGCLLTKAPKKLPATTLATQCYSGMFRSCDRLTTPPIISATRVATYSCQYMFYGCSALTTVPELKATTLASDCYTSMFMNCTSLTTVPSSTLPATTLANNAYATMFSGCTSLTTVQNLPASPTNMSCYYRMFYNCSSLTSITIGATSWNTSNAQDWVNGVSSSGTFTKPSGTSITTGTSGIPSGWTVVNV